MMRLIVCDDEELALERLQNLLARIADVEVVGVATNGRDALEQIATVQPDAVLLDIEMPTLDGFDVVEAISRANGRAPLIVFVTAFPEFATTAFDTGAIDFLAKPVRFGRLEESIARVRRALEGIDAKARLRELAGQLDALRAERSQDGDARRYLWVHSRGTASRIDLDRLDWIAAEGEYVRLMIGDVGYLHREAITAVVGRLDAKRYVRVHRSYVVDKAKIVSIVRSATGSYHLVMDGGTKIPIARSHRRFVRELIDGRPRALSQR